jgi:hypothetical protein
MSQPQWMRIDIDALEHPPLHLVAEDRCCFLREYTAGGGFRASTGNDDILNFKKNPNLRGTSQWPHKERAARKFAEELAVLFGDATLQACVLPSSKTVDDPEFDPRFDMMLGHLLTRCPHVEMVNPLRKRKNTRPLHGGGRRSIASIYDSLEWVGFAGEAPESMVVIDDMITSGTTFKACQKLLSEHCPRMQILGIFWTRCLWQDGNPPDDDAH